MSGSIHTTVKQVFGGKSRREVAEMVDDTDPDVLALVEKQRRKKEALHKRATEKLVAQQFDDEQMGEET